MPKTDCRRGTYPTNGAMLADTLANSAFKNDEDAFCEAPPPFSKPTLARALASGCSFEATLEKMARKLNLSSWRELLADPAQPRDEEPPPPAVTRQVLLDRTFATFDETADAQQLLAQIELLLARQIPFLIIAFRPGSVEIAMSLSMKDAREIDALYRAGVLAPLGVSAFNRPEYDLYETEIKALAEFLLVHVYGKRQSEVDQRLRGDIEDLYTLALELIELPDLRNPLRSRADELRQDILASF